MCFHRTRYVYSSQVIIDHIFKTGEEISRCLQEYFLSHYPVILMDSLSVKPISRHTVPTLSTYLSRQAAYTNSLSLINCFHYSTMLWPRRTIIEYAFSVLTTQNNSAREHTQTQTDRQRTSKDLIPTIGLICLIFVYMYQVMCSWKSFFKKPHDSPLFRKLVLVKLKQFSLLWLCFALCVCPKWIDFWSWFLEPQSLYCL